MASPHDENGFLAHRDALVAALAGERVTAILVTHCHSDHSPLAAWLREYTGAPTVAYGPHRVNTEWVDDDTPDEPDADDDHAVQVRPEGGERNEEPDGTRPPFEQLEDGLTGTHAELLNSSEVYSNLYRLQFTHAA